MNTPTPTPAPGPTHSSSTATTVTLLSTDETLAAETGLADRAALPRAVADDTATTEGGPPAARVSQQAPARSPADATQRSVSRRTRHLRKVRVILAELLRLEPEEIEVDSDLSADLGADSLDLAELVMALEEEFETSMMDAEAEEIQTVEDILSWLDDNVED